MEQYDYDSKIILAITDGKHQFNEIYNKAMRGKSYTTFTKHLTQLVEAGYIRKDGTNHKRPLYYLENYATTDFVHDDELTDSLNEEISQIKKKSKKWSNEKILNEFLKDIQKLSLALIKFNYQNLMCKQSKDNYVKTFIGLNEKRMELINKQITAMNNIVQEKDPKLYSTFIELVQINLDKLISKRN